MRNYRKYNKENYYQVIYKFHTLEDNRMENIAKILDLGVSYVGLRMTKYLENKENLGVLARSSTDMKSFVNICLTD